MIRLALVTLLVAYGLAVGGATKNGAHGMALYFCYSKDGGVLEIKALSEDSARRIYKECRGVEPQEVFAI